MQINIEHISKSYRKKQVLRDISFTAQAGTCIGILGSNGSGKSTLLSILAGVLGKDTGRFLLDGRDLFQDRKLRSQLCAGRRGKGVYLCDCRFNEQLALYL